MGCKLTTKMDAAQNFNQPANSLALYRWPRTNANPPRPYVVFNVWKSFARITNLPDLPPPSVASRSEFPPSPPPALLWEKPHTALPARGQNEMGNLGAPGAICVRANAKNSDFSLFARICKTRSVRELRARARVCVCAHAFKRRSCFQHHHKMHTHTHRHTHWSARNMGSKGSVLLAVHFAVRVPFLSFFFKILCFPMHDGDWLGGMMIGYHFH